MGSVHYFTACTLDGFIADEHNSLDWLFEIPHEENDPFWEEWFPGVGGLVMGATSYEWMLERYGLAEMTAKWSEWYEERPAWVFTHRELPLIEGVDITLVSGEVGDVYPKIAAKIGDAVTWLLGGGDLVGQFYDAGLLDTILLHMTPVTLGKGAPILPRRITSKNLAFRSAEPVDLRVRLILDVIRAD